MFISDAGNFLITAELGEFCALVDMRLQIQGVTEYRAKMREKIHTSHTLRENLSHSNEKKWRFRQLKHSQISSLSLTANEI